jgi:hypothetical protein
MMGKAKNGGRKKFTKEMKDGGVRKVYVSICTIQLFHLSVICVCRAKCRFLPLHKPILKWREKSENFKVDRKLYNFLLS